MNSGEFIFISVLCSYFNISGATENFHNRHTLTMERIRSIPLVMVVDLAVGTKMEVKVEVRVTLKQSWIKLKMCSGRSRTHTGSGYLYHRDLKVFL